MPRDVLIVKLSSLGDVVHAFAVLGDLQRCVPDVRVTWAVEEAFVELVSAHPLVQRVIAVPMRRLRREMRWRWLLSAHWRQVCRALRQEAFSVALDLQGLLKSALLMRFARADAYVGYDRQSARESFASLAYSQGVQVARQQHAVMRMRQLTAQVFQYALPNVVDYGLPRWSDSGSRELLFFHGTTWLSKLLPEQTWLRLIQLANEAGFQVSLPWGNAQEHARAERLAVAGAQVLPRLSLPELQARLYACAGVIAVDTGLGHLAAACGVPTLGVFAPTDANLTGMLGARVACLSMPSPCFTKDCRLHGADSAQGCMAQWSAQAIWNRFVLLKEEV